MTTSVNDVAGRYRLVRVIGEGGMGRVWLAHDQVLDRDVATKELVAADGPLNNWSRAIREAQAAARLAHPNVVRVYDVLHAGGRPWIVMEFVASRSLESVVDTGGPLSSAEAATIGVAVLDGLVAAHRAGVLHRDVKPQNVLLAADGRVLLGDFGIAAFDDAGLVTRELTLLGSPRYLAPERAKDGTSTVHTDLWSFGAMLYWAVEGRPPYTRPTVTAQLAALQSEPPDPMRRAGPLAPVIEGLLRHEPAQRLTATIARLMLCDAIAQEADRAVAEKAATEARLRAAREAYEAAQVAAAVQAAREAEHKAAQEPTQKIPAPRGHDFPGVVPSGAAGGHSFPEVVASGAAGGHSFPEVVASGATVDVQPPTSAFDALAERVVRINLIELMNQFEHGTGSQPATISEPEEATRAADREAADPPDAQPAAKEPARRRREAAIAVLAAAVLLAAGSATVVLREHPPVASRLAGSPVSPTPIQPRLACDVADTSPSTSASPAAPAGAGTPGPVPLPAGWVWQDDRAGFRIGIPSGWNRATEGTQVCFRDSTGQRRLTVQTGGSPDPDRVDAWRREEQQLLAGAPPVAYHRIAIAPAIFRQGGADWEYTYAAGGVTWHVLRRSFAVDAIRAYVLTWTTPDQDWTPSQPDFQAAATSFDAT